MRTIVDLPKNALAALTRLCRREKISRAEAVRRAVSLYLGQQARQPEAEVFGLWRGRKLEGRAYEDRLRDEWRAHEGGH
jgi:hypothetical protein